MKNHDGYTYAKMFFTGNNASSYDNLVKLATFGQDNRWKKEIVKKVYNNAIGLDLGCGTGILSSMLLSKRSTIIGIDLTFDYLKLLISKGLDINCTNGTAEYLPYRNNFFDFVVASYLPKYVDLGLLVEECWRVLKHNGLIIFHDFTYPKGNLLKRLWKVYFKFLKFGGKFVKSWSMVFKDLDKVIIESTWYDNLQTILSTKGFSNVSGKYITFGTSAIISAKKP